MRIFFRPVLKISKWCNIIPIDNNIIPQPKIIYPVFFIIGMGIDIFLEIFLTFLVLMCQIIVGDQKQGDLKSLIYDFII